MKFLVSDAYGDRWEDMTDAQKDGRLSQLIKIPVLEASDSENSCVTVSVACDEIFTLPWVQDSCEQRIKKSGTVRSGLNMLQ